MNMLNVAAAIALFGAVAGTALGQGSPTISGVYAFWWFGSGISYDGKGCPSGMPCAFASATWTANPNGATGTPTWHVQTNAGGGNVSLSCTMCTSTVATSAAPSAPCTFDVTVWVTYPDGSQSNYWFVFINEPYESVLQSGYPVNCEWGDPTCGQKNTPLSPNGFVTLYQWTMGDSCGYGVSNVDANEAFGSFSNDYTPTPNWGYPNAVSVYAASTTIGDQIGKNNGSIPPSTEPQSPLNGQKVLHDSPWNLYIGSQTSGSGASIRADSQQWYVDHGLHCALPNGC